MKTPLLALAVVGSTTLLLLAEKPDAGAPAAGTPAAGTPAAGNPVDPVFNRAPLVEKPYAELPLGAIEPRGWLRDELRRMAAGMTGHLDEWYPEVCGPRNAWLGGDGYTWERGPYWIDGLYPLAHLLDDEELLGKALPWIEWTLENQRENGQIGPRPIPDGERERPPPPGTQTHRPEDWWPRMVMLKLLQQHWYDDDGGITLPASWRLERRTDAGWKAIEPAGGRDL